jgi:uncharacterized damage-inducible protein DinB
MNPDEVQALAEFSSRVRESTLDPLRRVPEGKENVAFPPAAMSFTDIADHLIQGDHFLFTLPKTRFLAEYIGEVGQKFVDDRAQWDELIIELERLGERRRKFIQNLDQGALMTSIDYVRIQEPGHGVRSLREMIYGFLKHEAQHRGAVVVYLKLIDAGS